MKYRVFFSKNAVKDLNKLDKNISTIILKWINKNLEGIEDPRVIGKALIGNHSKEWRYRIGKYRLLCTIEDERLIIEVIKVGLRKNVYNIKK